MAVGTGVGVNTLMSRHYAHQEQRRANETAGTRRGAGPDQLGRICAAQCAAHAALCAALSRCPGGGGVCRDLWHHCLCRQLGPIFREHLDQDTPGGRQYGACQ